MAQAGEAAETTGRTSPKSNPKYEDDKVLDKLFAKYGKPDPDTSHSAELADPFRFTLRDTEQKVICLQGNNLVAASQASNVDPAEILVMPNNNVPKVSNKYPIFLGVGKRCLSCGTSKEPVLQLEDRDIISLYNDKSKNLPFTFISLMTGSTHQFQSLAHPGWFLCTSQGTNQAPLSITNHPGGTQITNFYFNKNTSG